ncbi:MAG: DUF3459 domain-containing protein, partial [Bacilli bacterium]|nr:DUF3459 domain-containing protein [Bacilli bacterium]
QWTSGLNAGFTQGIPWINLNPNHKKINVEDLETDPDSLLNFYRKIIHLRKKYPVIVYGDYLDIDFRNKDIYAYRRETDQESLTIVCNFSSKTFEYPYLESISYDSIILQNYEVETGSTLLRPYEARVYYKKK